MEGEAKEYYGRALLIREKTLPLEDPSLLGRLNLFANHYQNDDTNEREPIYRRLLTVHENLLGPDHPDVAGILDQLASVSQSQGTSVEAEQFFERALAIRDKALEPGHVDDFGGDVTESLLHLASQNLESGKEDKAEELLWRALVIHDQSPSPHEVRTTSTLQLLANLYHRQHRYAEAEPLYERLVTNWRSSRFIAKLPTAVPEGLAKLAEIYVNNGRLDDAGRLYRQSLGIWERIIGPQEPVLIRKIVDEVAISLFDVNGRDAEPEPLTDRALAALANATWPEHEQLVSTLEKFSDFLRDREHIGDSDRLGKEAKAIRNRYSEDPYSVEDSDSISTDFAFDKDEFGEESFKLIDQILARINLSEESREDLIGYKKDIVDGRFDVDDWRYLKGLNARLSK